MLRGPKRPSSPKKMMASPTTILKSYKPSASVKPSAPVVEPSSQVLSFTERLQMMAAKTTTMNKIKAVKDLKPEPASPISPISASKPYASVSTKRKVPAKRSAAIRKAKKPVAPSKKK